MPLTVCPDCGSQVSQRALACPKCGFAYRDPPTTGTMTIASGVFLGLLFWSLIPVVLGILFLGAIASAISGASY